MKKIKFEYVRLFIYCVTIVLVVFVVLGKINIKCYWMENYGVMCPACGITRASINIVKGNFAEAMQYHAYYTCVIMPLVTVLVVEDIIVILLRILFKKDTVSLVETLLGVSNGKNRSH